MPSWRDLWRAARRPSSAEARHRVSDPIDKIVLASPPRSGALRYTHILDAVAEAVRSGRIAPGERLPPQRELAERFGVALGTVSRAYAEAARRGLVSGAVGRGTFVAPASERRTWIEEASAADLIDLAVNRPPSAGAARVFAETIRAVSRHPGFAELLGDQPSAGAMRHRAAGARLAGAVGLEVAPERVIVTNGVQHALAAVIGSQASPGDVVLTEELNYPGIRLIEQLSRLRLVPIEMDGDGISPDRLERACRKYAPKMLFLTPTVHNPTTRTMPEERRRRIADIVLRHGLLLVEDDIYGLLPTEPQLPVSALVQGRAFYLTGTSKSLATGLRLGFVIAPEHAVRDVATAVQATSWMATSLMAEVVARWLEEGAISEILQWHRQEASRRQSIAEGILAGADFERDTVSYGLWLHLPEPWRQSDFALQARERGVLVAPSEAFMVGRNAAQHAVRVSFGEAADDAALERALRVLASLLTERPLLHAAAV